MNTHEVATRLVQLCREGKNIEAINELYHDDIVSYEQRGMPMEKTEGKEAVLNKSKHWITTVEEIHGGQISDPLVTGNFFSVTMDMDVTFKERGRTDIKEICVYEVKDGKIVFEQFFYSMGE